MDEQPATHSNATQRPGLRPCRALWMAVLLVLCAVLDALIPTAVNFGVIYLFVLPVAYLLGFERRALVICAALCSLLILAGIRSNADGAMLAYVLANRAIALSLLWLTAGLIIQYQQQNAAIGAKQRELEQALERLTEQNQQRQKTQLSSYNILADLEQVNQRLNTEIEQRRKVEQELKKYSAELERSNDALWEFATIASHDLQEPLRKIHGFTTLIQNDQQNVLTEESAGYFKRVRDAAQRMSGLIQGLLNYSRVATRSAPFVPVDLDQLLREVLENLAYAIEKKGARLLIEPLGTIDADPAQFSQVLQNLIGNSLKYSRAGVAPVIRIKREEADADSLRFSIEDNGIGFDAKYANNIFKVFTRLHRHDEYEGNGIGLSICRKIVERHGGTIVAEGVPDQMARFTITLPLSRKVDSK